MTRNGAGAVSLRGSGCAGAGGGSPLAIASVLVIAGAYGLMLTFYLSAHQSTGSLYIKNASGTRDLRALVSITSINPASDQLAIRVELQPSGKLSDASGLKRAVHVDVFHTRGTASYDYNVGAGVTPVDVTVGLLGNQSSYFFDTYSAPIRVLVSVSPATATTASGPPGAPAGGAKPVPVVTTPRLDFNGTLSGYHVIAQPLPNSSVPNELGLRLQITRDTATLAFAILILVLQGLLAIVAAVAAITAIQRHRRVDTSLLTFLAALLFAIVPLRNAMPEAPPIGAEVDVLVFFWAVTIICLALFTCLIMWLREAPASRQ